MDVEVVAGDVTSPLAPAYKSAAAVADPSCDDYAFPDAAADAAADAAGGHDWVVEAACKYNSPPFVFDFVVAPLDWMTSCHCLVLVVPRQPFLPDLHS